ncbi:MAG: hypothetical protein JW864_16245 [Spirochaetes bacterium]|nr:hypothetical protein [Spirochaetota bacterium]
MNDKQKLLALKNKITGVGSVPHTNIDLICGLIIQKCTIPYWPQLNNVDQRERMILQYTENLPCIKLGMNHEQVIYNSANRQNDLNNFNEKINSNNFEYFGISSNYSRGFNAFLGMAESIPSEFIKGQVVGPVTLLSSITAENGLPLLNDKELRESFILGLAMKGVWQVKKIRQAGKIPVLFFDEPVMAGFGSDYLSLERDEALEIFDKLISTVRKYEEALLGIHICGNSDWGLVLQAGFDIVNFDSFSYGKKFVSYPDNIKQFLDKDGIIAWGTVPTSSIDRNPDLEIVQTKFNEAINELIRQGIDRNFILERSMFTPACGTGTLREVTAERLINLTWEFAHSV